MSKGSRKRHQATFVYPADGVAKAYVAGDFNNWKPDEIRMTKRSGMFRKRLDLDPGEYQYKFIVDGKWCTDPAAAGQVPDGFGAMNSVVKV